MPATIVVGGQYGSEGKGKVVALLANRSKSPWLVRCGGPNSGHTVTMMATMSSSASSLLLGASRGHILCFSGMRDR